MASLYSFFITYLPSPHRLARLLRPGLLCSLPRSRRNANLPLCAALTGRWCAATLDSIMEELKALRAAAAAKHAAHKAAEAEREASAPRGRKGKGGKRAKAGGGGGGARRAKGQVLGGATGAAAIVGGAGVLGVPVAAAAAAATAGPGAAAATERAARAAAADVLGGAGAGLGGQTLGRSGGAVDDAQASLAVAMVRAAGGAKGGGQLAEALRKDFRTAVDLRERAEEGVLKVAAARASSATFSPLPDGSGRLAVRYTAGDRACTSGRGRAASGARGEVVADLPAALLPLILKALVGDSAHNEAVKRHLQPENMAVVCPRVFWAIVRHGMSNGRSFDEALRALCPDFDWDSAAVGQRESHRPAKYDGYVIGEEAQQAGVGEEAEQKPKRRRKAPKLAKEEEAEAGEPAGAETDAEGGDE